MSQKKDEAVVYFYRPSNFGSIVYYKIKDEDSKPISTMYIKSYYPYTTKKFGNRKFTAKTEVQREDSLNIEAGNTYFVETGVTFGVAVGRPSFKIVKDKEKALKDLKQCSISKD